MKTSIRVIARRSSCEIIAHVSGEFARPHPRFGWHSVARPCPGPRLARSGQAEPCEAPQQGGMGWGGALRGEAGEGGLKCYGRVSHC